VSFEKFHTFQSDSESGIVGSMYAAKHGVLFPNSGFVSRANFAKMQEHIYDIQYILYFNDLDSSTLTINYEPYRSQVGLQNTIASLWSKAADWLGFDTIVPVQLLHYFNCFALAILFSLIVWWTYYELGFLSGILVFSLFLVSPYCVLMAKNLFWTLWTYFFGFVGLLGFLYRDAEGKGFPAYKVFFFVVIATFIRLACGYEFITNYPFLIFAPILYYCLAYRWPWRIIWRRFLLVGVALGIGAGCTFALHLLQLHSQSTGMSFIRDRYLTRTFDGPGILPDFSTILSNYVDISALSLWVDDTLIHVTFRQLLVAAFLLAGLALAMITVKPLVLPNRSIKTRLLALLLTTTFAFFSFVPWIGLFRNHAECHRTLSQTIMYMPFGIYCIVLLGFAASSVLVVVGNLFFKKRLQTVDHSSEGVYASLPK
jgi:hypothetical protein